MDYDISKSVPQRGSGEETPQNRKINEIADELRRRCQIHEAQLRARQEHVNSIEVEQRVAEQYAKENGMWLTMSDVFDLGVPGPSGNENDTYVSNNIIYKVNNLLNINGSILRLLERITWHNNLFYDTRTIMPVLKQQLVQDAVPATSIEIDTYMAALGFEKMNDKGCYSNHDFVVWDLVPRNVLRDKDGDLYIIDAEIARKK